MDFITDRYIYHVTWELVISWRLLAAAWAVLCWTDNDDYFKTSSIIFPPPHIFELAAAASEYLEPGLESH